MIAKCPKCGKLIVGFSKFCRHCGEEVQKNVKEEFYKIEKKISKTKLKSSLFILSVIGIISFIVIFLVPFPYIAIEHYTIQEPYTDIEYYYENEPYYDTEYYYEREPYTVCAGYSFWTGECNEWKTEYENVQKSRTVTKYQGVKKSRTVTKYREEYKEREITKKATLYQMWSGQVKWYYGA